MRWSERRRRRQAAKLARLLAGLELVASEGRPAPPKRARLSLGRA